MSIKDLFKKLFKKREPDISAQYDCDEADEFLDDEQQHAEPGLIKKYTLFELMGRAIATREKSYVPTSLKMYEDKCCFEFNAFENEDNEDNNFVQYKCEAPYTPGQQAVSIIIDGIEFVWDVEDEFFRWVPFDEPQKAIQFNQWIEYFSNGELRIQKEYAEHNLSDGALGYAFYSCDEYYSWNADDGSYAPVMYEIPSAMKTVDTGGIIKLFEVDVNRAVRDLSYVNKYYEKECTDMNIGMLYAQYEKNKQRVLWEPDNE